MDPESATKSYLRLILLPQLDDEYSDWIAKPSPGTPPPRINRKSRSKTRRRRSVQIQIATTPTKKRRIIIKGPRKITGVVAGCSSSLPRIKYSGFEPLSCLKSRNLMEQGGKMLVPLHCC
ncbi:hypothetical protein ACHQM5_009830 [Ranunculus cassubicifolius]